MAIVMVSRYANKVFAKYWDRYTSMGDVFLDNVQGLRRAVGRSPVRGAVQNHYVAFMLLAALRDKIFRQQRVLCPAKLESREKGTIIAMLTADVETLEVFYRKPSQKASTSAKQVGDEWLKYLLKFKW